LYWIDEKIIPEVYDLNAQGKGKGTKFCVEWFYRIDKMSVGDVRTD